MGLVDSWRGVSVTLVVARSDIDVDFVASTLGANVKPLAETSRIDSSPDSWAWSFGDSVNGTLEQQVFSLAARIRPRLENVRGLIRDGCSVHVDIAGTVETGSEMLVSPDLLSELASLGVPLTFTCRTETGVAESDPLSWLDG
ncbi:hypothetical protein OHA98_05210 [Streptomyces sp. NBC_00654]|uniref:hypothetical protein n=1 Tax=Streptomyces sp. NBC_00654 TaxID=2975799 RepID=UPI0022590526|nr:hypothetical protein [Streptomyces sp. NBC_00654]MCX4964222.1 hypothetical protein [Streptomyces sp. NBC_00654]